MSLPIAWIEKLFLKLTIRYGREFTDRWAQVPEEVLLQDWSECLGVFFTRPGVFAYALDNLPEGKPPTAREFRALCYRAIDVQVQPPALAAPPADPAMVALIVEKLHQPVPVRVDHKAWAKVLRTRHEAGERLHKFQIEAYQTALKEVA